MRTLSARVPRVRRRARTQTIIRSAPLWTGILFNAAKGARGDRVGCCVLRAAMHLSRFEMPKAARVVFQNEVFYLTSISMKLQQHLGMTKV